MRHWSLSNKIVAGFALIILCATLMSAHILISMVGNSQRLDDAADRSDRAQAALAFERDLAELQGHFSTYVQSGLEQDLAAARRALNAASLRTDSLGERTDRSALAQDLAAFDADLTELTQLRAERERVKESAIRANGEAARKALSALLRDAIKEGLTDEAVAAGEALEATLLARLYVSRYYDQPLASEQKAVDDALAKARAALPPLTQSAWGDVARTARKADDLLAAYQSAFTDVVRLYGRAYVLSREVAPTRGRRLHAAAERIGQEAERGADAARIELIGSFDRLFWSAAAVGLAVLIIGAAAAAILRAGVVRPLSAMTAAMRRLASGDLDAPIPVVDRHDEIGAMAEAMTVFQSNMRRAHALEAAQTHAQAAQLARAEHIAAAAARFDDAARATAQSLLAAVAQTRGAADAIRDAADNTLERSASVAEASGMASVSAETVAAAAGALTQIVAEVADNAQRTSAISRKAMERLRGADAAVANLSDSAKNIGGVVALIEGVASQTSLLALNASIEAARAGEAGRGFAVVANEVKALASQTAAATADIVRRIQQVHADADAAIEVIRTVSGMVDEVDKVVDGVALAAEEQQAAAAEISRNAAETVESNQGVGVAISDVSDAADRTLALSSDLSNTADALRNDAENMRAAVEGFLDALRAA